jgi:hypothetical protein
MLKTLKDIEDYYLIQLDKLNEYDYRFYLDLFECDESVLIEYYKSGFRNTKQNSLKSKISALEHILDSIIEEDNKYNIDEPRFLCNMFDLFCNVNIKFPISFQDKLILITIKSDVRVNISLNIINCFIHNENITVDNKIKFSKIFNCFNDLTYIENPPQELQDYINLYSI